MKRTRMAVAGIAAVALSLALAGCGAKTDTAKTDESAPEAASTSAVASGGPTMTLNQYIDDNDIAEYPVKDGDPGTPDFAFPFPPDWRPAGDLTPSWAYGAIIYDKAEDPDDPPFMYAIASKLVGDIDPAKILELAPAQLNDFPEFRPVGEPKKDTLGGFDAINYVGTFVQEGKSRSVGQQTVVIPGKDALFVLQLNAEAPEGQEDVVIEAFNLISEKTTITLPS